MHTYSRTLATTQTRSAATAYSLIGPISAQFQPRVAYGKSPMHKPTVKYLLKDIEVLTIKKKAQTPFLPFQSVKKGRKPIMIHDISDVRSLRAVRVD